MSAVAVILVGHKVCLSSYFHSLFIYFAQSGQPLWSAWTSTASSYPPIVQTAWMGRLTWVFAGFTSLLFSPSPACTFVQSDQFARHSVDRQGPNQYILVNFAVPWLILLAFPAIICKFYKVIHANLYVLFFFHIWTALWQNQQTDCVPCEDSDQPLHPPSLIRVFTVCSMGT